MAVRLGPADALRATNEGGLGAFCDRAAIETGALAGQRLELAWLDNQVDTFFIHVQGSARLRLD
jgi:membrane-bound lytic murein transglycosylase A